MLWRRFAIAAYFLAVGSSVIAKENTPEDLNSKFDVKAKGVSKLLSKARALDGQEAYYENERISSYSIQFQGCHHIQQWNENADDEDVRLETKRLARFRLVPTAKCHVVSPWASSKAIRDASKYFGKVDYGEYVVDLNTFVASYLEAKQEENEGICDDYQETCEAKCDGDDDGYDTCLSNCYQLYGCITDDDGNDNEVDIYDYAGCANIDFDDGTDNGFEYYFGPSCADQGGEIKMNLFTDDTCTTLAQCDSSGSTRGATCYTRTTGYTLPGTKQNIIEEPCLACTQNYASLTESINDYSSFDFGYPRDVCTNLYDVSGKCEKYMKDGEYNYACGYLEGIQIGMSGEGYAVAVRRSVPADAAMFVLACGSLFMGLYISYMKNLVNPRK